MARNKVQFQKGLSEAEFVTIRRVTPCGLG
jgi:hypothetical protein